MADSSQSTLRPSDRLIHGPGDIVQRALGDDALRALHERYPHLVVLDSGTPQRSTTLRSLIDFNDGILAAVPAIELGPVTLVDPVEGRVDAGSHVLRREAIPLRRVDFVFVLRPVNRTRPARSPATSGESEAIRLLRAVVESGDTTELAVFIETMQLDRENALVRLRRLAEVHRDAVQNAVDIVQTKRIDFLERPQETGVTGSIMAFVVMIVVGNFLPSMLGSVFELLASGVFAIAGRRRVKGKLTTLSADIADRSARMRKFEKLLQDQSRQRGPERARALVIAKVGRSKKEKEISENVREVLLDRLLLDASKRAQDLREKLGERLADPKDPIGELDLIGNLEAAETVTEALSAVDQTKADDAARRTSALPMDVSLKMEVQDYFDPWIAAAESAIAFLKQVRLNVVILGTIPDEVMEELLVLVDASDELAAFGDKVASLTAQSVDIRAHLTAFYELWLWLTMYRTLLEKVPRIVISGFREVKMLPKARPGTMNLLRYLALRFFGFGSVKGEGKDAELVFTDLELLAVFQKAEVLCTKIFAPKDIGETSPDVTEALKELKFVAMPYERR